MVETRRQGGRLHLSYCRGAKRTSAETAGRRISALVSSSGQPNEPFLSNRPNRLPSARPRRTLTDRRAVMPHDKMVTLDSCNTLTKARHAARLLKAAGIPSFI